MSVSRLCTRLIEALIVFLLVFMVVIVFANVVLRYGFNSGIHLSDELSRYAFVWLTFLGAIVTFRENAHVNIETLVSRFGRRGRLVCMGLTQGVVMICAAAMVMGTLRLHPLNATMKATVSGIPMSWVSDVLGVCGAGIFLIAAVRLVAILTGRISQSELDAFAGQNLSEDHQ
ncbi:TRAP transporter small permease [Donghicola tyrosinivorans]|uniref:TRAP transporter small permease protein n=1 Tax=Donghicola tyrosinivorans TaxID=1652492 RepID=A0A2T0WEJ8_9RHOB|nr:TRAP transporter small permease [Donghicola tyrosinivorans]PRY85086.1 TRAP-type C4-dicarboxylate transport system permease small subunit [Donghicola tyrosinivorans]